MNDRRFEWDQAKASANLRKHGLSFELVDRVFTGRMFITPDHSADDEERWLAIGLLGMTVVAVVYTERGANLIRIISMRRANSNESATFWQDYPQ